MAIVYLIGCSDGLIPLQHAERRDQIEEERRLLYVAITRAARDLHVSGREPGNRAGVLTKAESIPGLDHERHCSYRPILGAARFAAFGWSGRSRGRKGPASVSIVRQGVGHTRESGPSDAVEPARRPSMKPSSRS